MVTGETLSGALQRSLDKIAAKKARSRAAMAAAFAKIEAQNVAAGLATDAHSLQLAEWARKHRTQLEAEAPASERDPHTLSLFDGLPAPCPVCRRPVTNPSPNGCEACLGF